MCKPQHVGRRVTGGTDTGCFQIGAQNKHKVWSEKPRIIQTISDKVQDGIGSQEENKFDGLCLHVLHGVIDNLQVVGGLGIKRIQIVVPAHDSTTTPDPGTEPAPISQKPPHPPARTTID